MFIGVDIGGTFTDVMLSENGRLRVHKLLSTPTQPAEAMLAGLIAIGATEQARLSHGSTVATNAILERKGAKTALITTAGFKDILAIGRQNRPDLYALHPTLPAPLIPREFCFEADERLTHTGEILKPLDIAGLNQVTKRLQAENIEAVAVCLLYAYLNPIHEQAIKSYLIEQGFRAEQIALSSEVLPQFREYERASTTALDAYVRPVISRYLSALEAEVPNPKNLWIMKSDGGLVSADAARAQAVQTALSGPAAGVIGAAYIAKLAGYERIITLDMGGTSTDVALCDGTPSQRGQSEIDGLPMRIPMIDIETVGAGGGSIAYVDMGEALRVGPQSAGAEPGPIIYGRGGTQVTVSDANAYLGRLHSDHFLGGQMALDLPNAQKAIEGLAEQVKLSPEQTALGIIEIANTNIERALRRVSVARGYDPRDFTLMAFGGAGPLQACEIAERLEIKRVLIPQHPGLMCALGLLVADVQRELSQPIMATLDQDLYTQTLQPALNVLQAKAQTDLLAEGIGQDAIQIKALADLRYKGQSYELSITILQDEENGQVDDLAQSFHSVHERRYGHAMLERSIEVVNLRVQAIGTIPKPTFERSMLQGEDASAAFLGVTSGLFRDGVGELALYDRERLSVGAKFEGAALLFQLDSTVFVPPAWKAEVDPFDNLILTC